MARFSRGTTTGTPPFLRLLRGDPSRGAGADRRFRRRNGDRRCSYGAEVSASGVKSAFLDIPLAAGLATERTVVHVIQRTRWARGMTQIFRVDNPLFGRGLTFQQRLCYLSAMLYYQFALPVVVFVTAPLAYLLFNLNIIYSSASLIVSYALPHLFLAIYVGSRMNGRYRYSFWGDLRYCAGLPRCCRLW